MKSEMNEERKHKELKRGTKKTTGTKKKS
jgi:hypothetical protein